MPLFLNKQVSEDTVLAIWKITEHKDELFKFIGKDFYEHETKNENLHWLASRALINQLFPDKKVAIAKDEFNKPSLKINNESYHISITHSFKFAAILVSQNKNVAIDMEKFDERIQRVKHKFMRDDELEYLDDELESKMLVTIWSAKETLYKFYGKKELDFKLHLKIEAFNFDSKFELTGLIQKENLKQNLKVNAEVLEDYVLTFIG